MSRWCSLAVMFCLLCLSSTLISALVPLDGRPGGDRRRAFRDFGVHMNDVLTVDIEGNVVNFDNATIKAPVALTTDQQNFVSQANGIQYHGGAVLSNAPTIYLIFYGNWAGSPVPAILTDLVSNLNNVAYFSILNTYFSTSGGNYYFLNTYPKYGGSSYDSYSSGTSITDAMVYNIVVNSVKLKKLPLNSNAVYFVIASSDVNPTSGMCTKYCGWHTAASVGTLTVRYSLIGSPMRCPNSCSKSAAVYPNNNREADGMANILMHELVEAMSDPDVDAWYDTSFMENADKCAWTWGNTYTTSNGATANMKIGTRDYLVQQNWVNTKGGYCGLRYP